MGKGCDVREGVLCVRERVRALHTPSYQKLQDTATPLEPMEQPTFGKPVLEEDPSGSDDEQEEQE